MGWFNYYGLAIMAVIMVPNIIYAVRHKDAANTYKNKSVEIAEQIGRYGCFVLMIFNIPYTYFNFWFDCALTVYLSVNGALCLAYLAFWVICRNNNGMLKALSLSILPSGIFLFSGIMLANIPLIVYSLVFAPCHILISCKNTEAQIYEVSDKRKYFQLLLLADEQPEMIEKYIDNSTMYVLNSGGVKGEITVSDMGNGVLEIKNLAVLPQFQRLGYGRQLVEFICEKYKAEFSVIQVGTGDSPLTLPFYERCGFVKSHTVKNFFTENYDHPIIEGGVMLKDMIYLTKKL